MKALFDTNILIDYLNGIAAAKKELDLYESRAISIVTWMEVMSGAIRRWVIQRARFSIASPSSQSASRSPNAPSRYAANVT